MNKTKLPRLPVPLWPGVRSPMNHGPMFTAAEAEEYGRECYELGHADALTQRLVDQLDAIAPECKP